MSRKKHDNTENVIREIQANDRRQDPFEFMELDDDDDDDDDFLNIGWLGELTS